MAFPTLEREKYISLATFRKSGKEVATPVWFAEAEGNLFVFTAADSGKVKRLRNSPRSRVAACSARGKVHGSWLDTQTVLLEQGERSAMAYRALRKKYGFSMWITDLMSRLTGRIHRRALLEISSLSSP